MKILYVTSEAVPFAKTGGLADVSGSLPAALRARGHDVRVIMPLYRTTDVSQYHVRMLANSLRVPLGDGEDRVDLLSVEEGHAVPTYFINDSDLFGRDSLYGYGDDGNRFVVFCRAVLDAMIRADFQPDVVHCHDWQTALVPVYLRTIVWDAPFFAPLATVFTIHNLRYQGLLSRHELPRTGLGWEVYRYDCMEHRGDINLMKGGLAYADLLSTVSPQYAREIQTAEYGEGLDAALRYRGERLCGILNGLDYSQWDPASDAHVPAHFSADNLAPRTENRRLLQERLGLPQNDALLLGVVTRFTWQKGIDLILDAMPELVERNVQLAVLGSAPEDERHLEHGFAYAQAHWPGQVGISLGQFDESLARLIYAGSDAFLMPSRYEPCGLGQLIALRYGSVPLVRYTGGLADTVLDCDGDPQRGTGFTFGDFTAAGLLHTVDRALALRQEPARWQALQQRGMQADFSWAASAEQYEKLFEKACAHRRRDRGLDP